jgi:hypothetical protein
MPHSGTLLDREAAAFLACTGARTVLDIGAGAGKWACLVRAALPHARLIAVEVEPSYVDRFDLGSRYDEVRIMPAIDLLEDIEAEYDLVILGDVIEHHRKSAGLDLLHFLIYRTRYLLIQYPERYRQNALDGARSEAHLSVWREADFQGLDAPGIRFWHKAPLMLVAINGYLPGVPVEQMEIKR